MKFYYLTDTSEKSLAPFFAPKLLSATFYGVLIIGACMAVFWPWQQDLVSFIRQSKGPSVFFPVFTAALIIYAYVQLRCGRGEIIQSSFSVSYLKNVPTFELENNFLSYGLVEFVLHILFSLFPVLPLLILATSISGFPLNALAKGIFIIVTTALFFRMIGFLTYLFWGRGSLLGYMMSRVCLMIFLALTAVYVPSINPIRLVYALNKNLSNPAGFVSLTLYAGAVLLPILLFILMSYLLVRRHMRRET